MFNFASYTKSNWAQLVIIAFVLAFCCVFGTSYNIGEGYAALSLPVEIALTLAATLFFAIALSAIDAIFGILSSKTQNPNTSTNSETPPRPTLYSRLRAHIKHPTFAAFAMIILCWLPWLIANFPGTTYWDTYWQIWQVYPEAHPVALIQWAPVRNSTLTDAWLVDHHPILTTLVFGGAAWISDQLTGNWLAGVFVLSTIQTLAYAAIFANMLKMFRRWNTPGAVCLFLLAFLCLMPAIPTWASCVVKDSVFGLFFLPWLLMLANIIRTHATTLTRKDALVMTLLAILMCLTKKTGIFIIVITAIVCCVAYRKSRPAVRTFAIQAASCLLLIAVILPMIVFPLANISPGGRQETLGPLLQQTSRYAQTNQLSAEEEQTIDAIVDIERVKEHYQFDFQDGVKYYYRVNSTDGELAEYLKLYLEQGIKDPESYFAAIMSQAGMYVAPTTFYNIRMVTVNTFIGEEKRHVLWNPEVLTPMREGLDNAYSAVASIPVLNLPFLTVTYVLWIPAALLFINYRRRLGLGLLFIPLAVTIGFCVIAPVFDARYAWGMLLATPVIIACSHIPPFYRSGLFVTRSLCEPRN